jgi:hypothetical protein
VNRDISEQRIALIDEIEHGARQSMPRPMNVWAPLQTGNIERSETSATFEAPQAMRRRQYRMRDPRPMGWCATVVSRPTSADEYQPRTDPDCFALTG